jgi:hypothetical protein
MKKTTTTFQRSGGFSILSRVRAATTLDLRVVPVAHGKHVVTDATHLKFNATYKSEQDAQRAAFFAMARRTR